MPVSGTFSVSSLKFLLKLVSHYKKLQNMSQVFYPRWETIDSRFLSTDSCRTSDLFPTCLRAIAELSILDISSRFCLQMCTKPKRSDEELFIGDYARIVGRPSYLRNARSRLPFIQTQRAQREW